MRANLLAKNIHGLCIFYAIVLSIAKIRSAEPPVVLERNYKEKEGVTYHTIKYEAIFTFSGGLCFTEKKLLFPIKIRTTDEKKEYVATVVSVPPEMQLAGEYKRVDWGLPTVKCTQGVVQQGGWTSSREDGNIEMANRAYLVDLSFGEKYPEWINVNTAYIYKDALQHGSVIVLTPTILFPPHPGLHYGGVLSAYSVAIEGGATYNNGVVTIDEGLAGQYKEIVLDFSIKRLLINIR